MPRISQKHSEKKPETSAKGQRRSPTKRIKDAPLKEQDWVDAAIQILVRDNVRGIKIDTLCKSLGVTKGSFYWHFATRGELLLAMLSNWRRRMTIDVIRSITRSGAEARQQLRSLLSLPRQPKSPAFAQIEFSIRDWGRRVEMPHQVVEEVDKIRLNYFENLFLEQGLPRHEARERAYVTYCLMMGDSILHHTLEGVSSDRFVDLAMELVTKQKDPAAPSN